MPRRCHLGDQSCVRRPVTSSWWSRQVWTITRTRDRRSTDRENEHVHEVEADRARFPAGGVGCQRRL